MTTAGAHISPQVAPSRLPIFHTLRSDGSYLTAASLALDTNGCAPTFARNCAAYRDYWSGSLRVLASVAANVPRWCTRKDVGGTQRSGILIEPETTNLAIQANVFSAWTAERCSVGTSTVDGPFGATHYNIAEDNALNYRDIYKTLSSGLTATTKYVLSCWARKETRDYFILRIYNGGGGNDVHSYFSLVDGSAGAQTGPIDAYGFEDWGGGWIRFWIAWTQPNNYTGKIELYPATSSSSASYQGVLGQVACQIAGVQLAASVYPTSFIPTTTAPATRLKDELRYDVTGKIGAKGSLVYSFMRSNHDLGFDIVPVSLHDGSANNRITASILASGDKASTTVVASSATQADITDATTDIVNGNVHTAAASWETNSVKQYVDGAAEGTADVSATIPTGLTTLELADSSAAGQCGGLVSDVKIYLQPERAT